MIVIKRLKAIINKSLIHRLTSERFMYPNKTMAMAIITSSQRRQELSPPCIHHQIWKKLTLHLRALPNHYLAKYDVKDDLLLLFYMICMRRKLKDQRWIILPYVLSQRSVAGIIVYVLGSSSKRGRIKYIDAIKIRY